MSELTEVTNLDPDPNALKGRYNWGASIVRSADGRHWSYIGKGNSYMGSCTQSVAAAAPVGHVIVLIAQTVDTAFAPAKISAADGLLNEQAGDTYIKAARITATGLHDVPISKCTTGVTILGSALYTPDDWEQVLSLYQRGALQYPWFAGDLYPRESVGGLSLLAVYPHHLELGVVA